MLEAVRVAQKLFDVFHSGRYSLAMRSKGCDNIWHCLHSNRVLIRERAMAPEVHAKVHDTRRVDGQDSREFPPNSSRQSLFAAHPYGSILP